MTTVPPMEIHIFFELVNKARVVEEYAKIVASPKDTHGGNTTRGRGKYFHPRGQSFKRGGYAPQDQGDFRKNTQNQFQHAKGRGNQSKISPNLTYVRCGHFHPYDSCKIGLGSCFNCGLPGHIARDCTREKNPNAVAVYDIGASHLFISFDKVEELGLKVLEIILGFDWLSKNRVLLDCFERSIQFMPEGENRAVIAEGFYLNFVIVHCSREESHDYILLTANALGDAQNLDQIPIVRDFSELFPKDIPKFPPQREIKFAIELVPGAGPANVVADALSQKSLTIAWMRIKEEELVDKFVDLKLNIGKVARRACLNQLQISSTFKIEIQRAQQDEQKLQ
ncbi:uncharacterized protein LOC107607920 [Arachis ipaensis]|uniref:uncharacterized protein LOC107607920 n=1 Tax=Arachis ipaensis TaxID=130454 RepID=UPI0007AF0A48|nr:uncharacterized protein LOC107607920 [Arachis ipaensis]